ncbi:homoserine kinase [uncultured Pseudokineococcus sp.]|uniref:homoserine kinase n=1 Tax=uncultured Pseudokineococcus sp. TaxID=1642928 RepID=UPI00261A5496|nr:homoserine kinase [uncultured Pseudokineococcus sp.]
MPGSSANLGPAFDAVGLALDLRDELAVRLLAPGAGVRVEVTGQGAGRVAAGEGHLVVRALRTALERVGAPQPDLALVCRNGVPFGRGAGSSAAAVVAGVVLARALLEEPGLLDDETALDVAAGMEGHPDNAAASLLGGVTIGWVDDGVSRAVRAEPSADLVAVLAVPSAELLTARARAMLPAVVPHGDAVFNAGRAALLVEALTRRPELLLPATADRLHQDCRAPAAPATAALVGALRAQGLAAAVSGAGPSVLVLAGVGAAGAPALAERVTAVAGPGWDVRTPAVDRGGARWSPVTSPPATS